jgi:uncharacterized protein
MKGRMGMSSLKEIFSVEKPLIGMVHLPPLPGRNRYDKDLGMGYIIEHTHRDLLALQNNGIDGVIFCNEGDLPYTLHVASAQIAAMAAVIGQLKSEITVPFGVNLLFDPHATLSVAQAVGARFVREVFTGVFESDMGWMSPDPAELFDLRKQIGAEDIAIFNNICPEFSRSPAGRTVAERAKIAEFFGSDAILVSGIAAGTPVDLGQITEAKDAVAHTPVIANTGVRMDNLEKTMQIADGMIVGTALKEDGYTWNPVNPTRVKEMSQKVRELRGLAE